MKNKSKNYFALAGEYLESSKLLLNTILENENISVGAGFSTEDAVKDLSMHILKSDVFLLIPALFLGYQSIELYIKGLLLLKNIPINMEHEASVFYDSLKECYGEESDIYKSISDFYSQQIEIIKKFKKINNITTVKELYEALRYPENTKNQQYDHSNFKLNGKKALNQMKKTINQMDLIRNNVNKEIDKEFNEL